MKFAEIISLAGLDSNSYPKLAEIKVELYDLKNNLLDEVPEYSSPIFSVREDSLEKFISFLDEHENKADLPDTLVVKLNKAVLGIYPTGQKPALFMRAK